MLIEYRNIEPNMLWPYAAAVLGNVSVPLFHEGYNLRPPLGVYNTSLEAVIPRVRRALNAFKQVDIKIPQTSQGSGAPDADLVEDFLSAYQDLLYGMFEHLEDCDSIIKCFFPPDTHFEKDPRVREYKTTLQWYRRRLGAAVNAIKHNQNRLRMIWFTGPMACSYGYFVEAVQPGGTLGPNPNVHSKGDTAFSFGYDFRLHFVHLYAVGEYLSNFVQAVDHGVVAQVASKCPWACEIAGQIQGLHNFRFPDELSEPNPEVEVSDHDGVQLLRLGLGRENQAPISITNLPPPIRIGVSYRGDGVTRSFKLPYSNEGVKT